MSKRKWFCFVILSFVINTARLFALDSIASKPIKLPKHYFSNTIYLDSYSPGMRTLDTINKVSKKLKTYKISQLALGFNVPVITKDYYNKDSTIIKNVHFLLTGGINNLYLDFGGISKHTLSKDFLGFRGLYNNGKKSLFFLEFAPFITKDNGYRNTAILRFSTTFVYNLTVNENFSLRFGFTRSFLYGNLYNLPYIGFRVGKLDKTNFSFQFPRSMTLNIPAGKYVRTSVYAKPQGGFYTFSNHDSLALGAINDNKKLYFGRTEFLLGTRVDILPTRIFSFYVSAGITTGNTIEFFPTKSKANVVNPYDLNFTENIKGGGFLNFGMVFKFGKTKSIYNNQQMYNAVDINNGIGGGDNNIQHNNSEIPTGKQKLGTNKTDDVIDLIEATDLY